MTIEPKIFAKHFILERAKEKFFRSVARCRTLSFIFTSILLLLVHRLKKFRLSISSATTFRNKPDLGVCDPLKINLKNLKNFTANYGSVGELKSSFN